MSSRSDPAPGERPSLDPVEQGFKDFDAATGELTIRDAGLDAAGLVAELRKRQGILAAIRMFNVSGNEIGDEGVQTIASMLPGLQRLSLRGDPSIRSLDPLAPLVAPVGPLFELEIRGCEGVRHHYRLDASVMEYKDARQIFDVIGRARPDDRAPLATLKAMLLGNGRAGKTSLRHRLMNEMPPERVDPTHSFEAVTLPETYRCGNSSDARIRVFDIGGQPALHSAHRLFLGGVRNLFIVVCDGSRTPEQAMLPYWLRMVAHQGVAPGGRRLPVLVVVTHHDRGEHEDWQAWRAGHPLCAQLEGETRLEVRWVWAYRDRPADAEGPAEFDESKLHEVRARVREIVEEMGGTDAPEFPPGFERIYQWLLAGDAGPHAELYGTPAFVGRLKVEEFRAACARVGTTRTDVQNRWLRELNHLGATCWFGDLPDADELGNESVSQWIYRPDWLKRPVYELLREAHRRDGNEWPPSVVTRAEVERLLSDFRIGADRVRLSTEEARDVLAVMRVTRMAFNLAEEHGRANAYLLVDRLFVSTPPDGRDGFVGPEVLQCAFVSEGSLPRLIGDKRVHVADLFARSWRNWAIFHFPEDDVDVLVSVDLNAATASFAARCGKPGHRKARVRELIEWFKRPLLRDQVKVRHVGRTDHPHAAAGGVVNDVTVRRGWKVILEPKKRKNTRETHRNLAIAILECLSDRDDHSAADIHAKCKNFRISTSPIDALRNQLCTSEPKFVIKRNGSNSYYITDAGARLLEILKGS